MNVYNIRRLSQNQRFGVAIIIGIVSAIVLGIVSGLFRQQFNFSLILVGVGYVIALLIQKFGRGVQQRFSVLAVLCTFVAIIISDIVLLYGVARLLDFQYYPVFIRVVLVDGITSVIWFLYRGFALYIAYNYARVI